MSAKVYIETSIISYLAARLSRDPVTAGRQLITRHWWETEREKYSLLISEAVVAECERGDPLLIDRRRQVLNGLSLFSVNENILRVARLLMTPGAIPPKAGPDAVHIAAAAVEESRVPSDLELSSHRECTYSSTGREDSERSWLWENDNLHTGRTRLNCSLAKTKSCENCTQFEMPMRRSTITI